MKKPIILVILYFMIVCVGCSATRKNYVEFSYVPTKQVTEILKDHKIKVSKPIDERKGSSGNYIGHGTRSELVSMDKMEDILGLSLIKLIKSHGFQVYYSSRSNEEVDSVPGTVLKTIINQFDVDIRFSHGGFYPITKLRFIGKGQVELNLSFAERASDIILWAKNISMNPYYEKAFSNKEGAAAFQEVLDNLFKQIMGRINEEIPWGMLEKSFSKRGNGVSP